MSSPCFGTDRKTSQPPASVAQPITGSIRRARRSDPRGGKLEIGMARVIIPK
jgi:hypothetical protein